MGTKIKILAMENEESRISEKAIKKLYMGGKMKDYLGRIRMVVLKVLSLPRNQELLDINTYSTNLNIYKCNNVNITGVKYSYSYSMSLF